MDANHLNRLEESMPLLDQVDSLIIDMDGVLWRENSPIGNLQKIFQTIASKSLKVTLATNNATLSVPEYLKKLSQFGVILNEDQIVNSPLAVVRFLLNLYPGGGPVFIIGENGLINTLACHGFWQSGGTKVVAVVVGLDRRLTFKKLSKATLLIRSGVNFIGTNADNTLPVTNGLIPGVGAILAALITASDVKPIIVGKPEPDLFVLAMQRMNTIPEKTMVIGDRLESDILGGQKLGCHTGLVLTGVTSEELANRWHPSPDIVAPNLTELLLSLP
jgi:4-nitrophenyl phosphatase